MQTSKNLVDNFLLYGVHDAVFHQMDNHFNKTNSSNSNKNGNAKTSSIVQTAELVTQTVNGQV